MEEQQEGYPQYIYPQPYSQMQDGLLQYQLDPDEIISNIENTLLGKKPKLNQRTNSIEWSDSNKSTRHINEKGMSALLVPLQSRLTKIFVLSDLDDEKIENMTMALAENIIDTLLEHWEEYEVKSVSSASMIVGLIVDAVNATLCKAKNHNYLTFLKTAQRIHEIQQYRVGHPAPQAQEKAKTRIPLVGKFFGK